jgi:hypothetical protein
MIARFDHRPMLTAALALSTIVLLEVVVTLSTLLITAAPPAAPALSGSAGENPRPCSPANTTEACGTTTDTTLIHQNLLRRVTERRS